MTEKPFAVVHRNGMKFLAERKTNYLLPVASVEAMCILLNYVYINKDIPNVDTVGWEKREEMQEYLREDKE